MHKVILPESERGEKEDEVDLDDNAKVYAELIQCLDDTSINLVFRDARDDAGQALTILRSHYMFAEKPRFIALYTEMINLAKRSEEELTQFILRAETVKAQVVKAGEEISDSLLIALARDCQANSTFRHHDIKSKFREIRGIQKKSSDIRRNDESMQTRWGWIVSCM